MRVVVAAADDAGRTSGAAETIELIAAFYAQETLFRRTASPRQAGAPLQPCLDGSERELAAERWSNDTANVSVDDNSKLCC